MTEPKQRRVTKQTEQAIREHCRISAMTGAPPETVARLCADYAIALLEVPVEAQADWYEQDGSELSELVRLRAIVKGICDDLCIPEPGDDESADDVLSRIRSATEEERMAWELGDDL